MSTEHLDIPEEELDKLLGGVGSAARHDDDDKLTKDIDGIGAQIVNIAYGASALIQRKQDDQDKLRENLAERQRQRELIRQRAERTLVVASDPETVAVDDPSGTAIQPPVVVDAPDDPSGTAIQPPVVVDAPHTNIFVVFVSWVRDFTWLQWVLAIILAIIGVWVAVENNGFIDDLPQVAEQVVKGVLVVGSGFLGFGLGGYIGSLIENRRGNATA